LLTFVETLDYIFFTSSHLRALAALKMPERQALERDTALPSTLVTTRVYTHHRFFISI
jgi:hypothetical protein